MEGMSPQTVVVFELSCVLQEGLVFMLTPKEPSCHMLAYYDNAFHVLALTAMKLQPTTSSSASRTRARTLVCVQVHRLAKCSNAICAICAI
jgi:hypothetical protein